MSSQCRWPGTSRQSRLTQVDKWWALSQQLRGELAIVGVEVPDSFAVGTRRAGLSVDGSASTDPSRPSQPVAGRFSQVRDLEGNWCSRQSRPALEVTTDTHILQLRVDFYRAEAVDRTLFEAYQRRNDDSRASKAAGALGREINRLVMLSSVAPSVQEEVLIQERFDLLEVLKKEFEALMTKSAKAAP